MRYTARALTAVSERPTIRLGRSDPSLARERPLGWRLRRWWLRRFRTWTPYLISTPQMLALQAANAVGPLQYVIALAVVLRTVFPRRWWYRFTGDPVTMILQLGVEAPVLQAKVLERLVRGPDGDQDESTRPDDPVEAMRRSQRLAVYGDERETGGRVSLSMASLAVRVAYGDGWYYAPDRWPTADGYVPFTVCLLEYVGLQALEARRRLEVADGFAIANATDPRRARAYLEKMAYPTDQVC